MSSLGGVASSILFLRGSWVGETHSILEGLEEKRRGEYRLLVAVSMSVLRDNVMCW